MLYVLSLQSFSPLFHFYYEKTKTSVPIRSFFWSVFSFFRTELLRKSLYSVPVQENTDQKDSVFGHFPHSTNEVEFGRKFSIQQALKV